MAVDYLSRALGGRLLVNRLQAGNVQATRAVTGALEDGTSSSNPNIWSGSPPPPSRNLTNVEIGGIVSNTPAVPTTSQTSTASGGAPGAAFGPAGVANAPVAAPLSSLGVGANFLAKAVPAVAAVFFWVEGERGLAIAAAAAAVGAYVLL